MGATVLLTNENTFTTTNNYGFFSISCKNRAANVLITHAGYSLYQQEYVITRNNSVNIKLSNNNSLIEVVVVSSKTPPLRQLEGLSIIQAMLSVTYGIKF